MKKEKVFVDRVKAIAEIKVIIQANMSAKTPEERIAFAKERLVHPNTQRPRSRKSGCSVALLPARPPHSGSHDPLSFARDLVVG